MLTRFAPSPTGYLHIGNARTALLCYLFAKKSGGQFMLRIDDTDSERNKEEYVDAIKEDLTWLGLTWDKFERQSQRTENYKKAVEKLKAAGRLYACYETEQELDIKRKMLLSRGKPPIYDRAALKLTDAEKKAFESEGRKPHFRFKLNDSKIIWNDLIRSEISFEGHNLSDPILLREDGSFTYMLPSAVDDAELGITHVIRGEDHITNTAIQIQLFEALGAKIPLFAHNSFIKTKEGKLSKREGSFSLRDMRKEGFEPMAINSFMAKVGTSDQIGIRATLEDLAKDFDFAKFSKSATFYAPEDIMRLNSQLLHETKFADVKTRLAELGLTKIDEEFWNSVRPNISSLPEAKQWWDILHGDVNAELNADERTFTRSTVSLLPSAPWNEATYDAWISAIKSATPRKGKELFMPLRLALTGLDHGPELKKLLPLLGPEIAKKRLKS